jgi:hypothetical protein
MISGMRLPTNLLALSIGALSLCFFWSTRATGAETTPDKDIDICYVSFRDYDAYKNLREFVVRFEPIPRAVLFTDAGYEDFYYEEKKRVKKVCDELIKKYAVLRDDARQRIISADNALFVNLKSAGGDTTTKYRFVDDAVFNYREGLVLLKSEYELLKRLAKETEASAEFFRNKAKDCEAIWKQQPNKKCYCPGHDATKYEKCETMAEDFLKLATNLLVDASGGADKTDIQARISCLKDHRNDTTGIDDCLKSGPVYKLGAVK